MKSNSDRFFRAIGVRPGNRRELTAFAKSSGVSAERLSLYDSRNLLPTGDDLARILRAARISHAELMLRMGVYDQRLRSALEVHAAQVAAILEQDPAPADDQQGDGAHVKPAFRTSLGVLYRSDCMPVLKCVESGSVDLVFADPPFNLRKIYPSRINDDVREQQYLAWCETWLGECIRVLKDGGSFFLWNLPKWNIPLAEYLRGRLTFKHWISVDIKYGLPIQGRLYPSHYSLLYFCKGEKPAKFHPDRLPMPVCKKCFADQRDYGGYKDKMNPEGINLTDVWYDIPPVRHLRYKKRPGANELSIRVLDRVVEMASDEGDLVLDPFGGSGTTYAVSELKGRRWIGMEIGPVDGIVERLQNLEEEGAVLEKIRADYNQLFTRDVAAGRRRAGLWTAESVRNRVTYPDAQSGGREQLVLIREGEGKEAV